VAAELEKGTSIRKIAELLDISTSTVQAYKRKVTAHGNAALNEKADQLTTKKEN